MKKMNKVAAAVLAVAMVGSMAMPAFAKDAGEQNATDGSTGTKLTQQGTTKLTYVIDESYSWTIPANTEFDKGNNTGVITGKVHVKDCIINLDDTLTVTIDPLDSNSNKINKFELNTDVSGLADQAKMGYAVKNTANNDYILGAGDKVLTLQGGKGNEATTNLTFTLLDDQTVGSKTAGSYTGYVQFTATVGKTK